MSADVKKPPAPLFTRVFGGSGGGIDMVPFLPKLRLKTFPEFKRWYL